MNVLLTDILKRYIEKGEKTLNLGSFNTSYEETLKEMSISWFRTLQPENNYKQTLYKGYVSTGLVVITPNLNLRWGSFKEECLHNGVRKSAYTRACLLKFLSIVRNTYFRGVFTAGAFGIQVQVTDLYFPENKLEFCYNFTK